MKKNKGFALTKTGLLLLSVLTAAMQITIYTKASGSTEFPEKYEAENENVIFDCRIEKPESAAQDGIYATEVKGRRYADPGKAISLLCEGKEITKQFDYPEDGDIPASSSFVYADGSYLSAGSTLTYGSPDANSYLSIGILNDSSWEEGNYVQEQLDFGSVQACMEEMKGLLDELGVCSDNFQYSWFSLNKEQLAEIEAWHVEDELLEAEKAKGDWAKEDEIYVICGFQYNQELPVFHEIMGMYQQFALDSILNMPVIAVYSSRGLEYLILLDIYDLEQTDEAIEFMQFEELAETVDAKYNELLTSAQYVVERAKLFQMVRKSEAQKLIAEPAWRFEVEVLDGDTEKTRVVIVDAVTGKEIPLP